MEDDVVWHTEPPHAPGIGKREMHLRGKDIRKVMQGKRGLVGKDALLLRPEPDHREVLVVPRGEVHEPVHAASHAHHAPGPQMMRDQLRRVSGRGRLARREEPVLDRRDLEEVVPVGRAGSRPVHAKT